MEQGLCPEEAILIRAVKDAIAFVEDSKRNRADTLWKRSLEIASDQSGVELDDRLRPMYLKVFASAVDALLAWDFDTDFEHNR